MPISKKLVLIDASWLAYKAQYSMGGLSHQSEATGVIFGFLEQLRVVCLNPKVASNNVAICFDSSQSFRKEQHPFYKAKRAAERTSEEWVAISAMQEQVKRLRKEILPAIGIPCLMQSGLESDDMMAQAAKQYVGPGVMITADKDLYQCITDQFHWYDPTPARNLYLDPAAMMAKYRVGPNDWAEVKCMCGCHSDNIPGVPGVGEKSAIDHIWKLLKEGSVKRTNLESKEGRKIIKRNRGLIILPHPSVETLILTPPMFVPNVLFNWAEKLGFQSYLDGGRRKAWEQFFNGSFSSLDRQTIRRRGA